MSCLDCLEPVFNGNENAELMITISDSAKCLSKSKKIEVKVEKSCVCGRDLEAVKIKFGQISYNKYISKPPGKNADWDWQIISTMSGAFLFDIVCNPSCAKDFKLSIKSLNGQLVYERIYNRLDVNEKNKNPLHTKYQDSFIFTIDLSDYEGKDDIHKKEVKIEIVPIDSNGEECTSKKYVSPVLSLTKCN